MDKKLRYLIISIVIMIIVMITGTFAWLTFRSNKTAMVLTIGDINNVQVTLQPYQINANIVPRTTFSTTDNNIKSVNVEATNNTGYKKRISIYYVINSIDADLKSNNFQYVITRKTETDNDYVSYKTGNFSSASAGRDFEILNEKIPENSTYEYKVYLWLNGAESENEQGATFNGELRANINFDNRMQSPDSSAYVFSSQIKRNTIEKVTFLNTIPDNITSADQPLDVSVEGNGNVIAYFKDVDSNSLYEMYIAADGQIVPINLPSFFSQYKVVTEINNLNYLDTSNVTSMAHMFHACDLLVSLDLSGFDTSNVTDMNSMFFYCRKLANLNISNFDTSNVTDMSQMFAECKNLTTLDLRHFNTSKVTDMGAMFFNSSKLSVIDLSSFDTSSVVGMDYMFYNNAALTTIYVSDRWDTSNVTDSYGMFYDCEELPNFDDNFDDKTKAHYGPGGYLTYKAYP